ncbi:hypothetical protein AB1Y20_014769 [Prymnesium parvum]|uniref:Methyltransferase type 12 domain-containing protein n=1 Tax=Prymnesium parvum TaxID=97485 RepID=A0AB34IBV7_PRYPA
MLTARPSRADQLAALLHSLIPPEVRRADWQLRGGSEPTEDAIRTLLEFHEAVVGPVCAAFAYALPCDAALRAIAARAPRGVVEVGAGTGLWASLLREYGVVVHAYDRAEFQRARGVETFTFVRDGGHEAAAAHSECALLLCWPALELECAAEYGAAGAASAPNMMASDALQCFQGDTVIYVGESAGATGFLAHLSWRTACGHTAGPVFQRKLEEGWNLVELVKTPRWPGLGDKLYIFHRKAMEELRAEEVALREASGISGHGEIGGAPVDGALRLALLSRPASTPPSPLSVLLLACGDAEALLSPLRAFGADLTCIEPLPALRARLAASHALHALRAPPSRASFDLVLAPPRFLHASSSAEAALRAVAPLLRPHAVALVACDGLLGGAGVAHARQMLRALRAPAAEWRLAVALLQTLPPSSWLRRNRLAAAARNWSDAAVARAQLLRPRRTAELPLFRLLAAARRAGLVALRPAEDAPPLPRRLAARAAALPWPWQAQLAELLAAAPLTHELCFRRRDAAPPDAAEDAAIASLEMELHARLEHGLLPAAPRRAPLAAPSGVRQQYEQLPYPPRHPADEEHRLIRSSLASINEASHFLFGGRWQRTFCAAATPFRALIAGGGTGDATVQLAVELASLHAASPHCLYSRSALVHLDLSAASVAVARARLQRRGLLHGGGAAVTLLVGSIYDLPRLGVGRFHYINHCGVLHHLPDSATALRRLAASLYPSGGIGLMVYGAVGRVGVYETQAALRLLHAGGNSSAGGAPYSAAARVADALELLPASRLMRSNAPVWSSQEARGEMGDAGVFDLLLHSLDVPYTVAQLLREVKAAGLRATGWLQPALYEPRAWLRQCSAAWGPCEELPWDSLQARLRQLSPEDAAAFAELAGGHARKHWVYLALAANASTEDGGLLTPREAGVDEADLSPCPLNLSEAVLSLVAQHAGRPLRVVSSLQGEALYMHLPRLSAAFLPRLDCKRPLRQVVADVISQVAGQLSAEEVWTEWGELARQLTGVGFLTMTDLWQ